MEDRRRRKRVDLHFCVWQQQLFCLPLQKLKKTLEKKHVSDKKAQNHEAEDVDNSSTQTVTGQHQPISGLLPENLLTYDDPNFHLLESLSDVVSSQLDHSVSTSNNSSVSKTPQKRHLKDFCNTC